MMSKVLLFALPFDFVRVFWIITPLDAVVAIYFVRRMMSGQFNKSLFQIFTILMFPLVSIALISGMKNSQVGVDHLILVVGILLSALKGVALVDSIVREGKIDLRALAMGFLAISILSILFIFQGFGLSGSGRAQGILNHSNGFGALQTFSFALALSIMFQHQILSISLIALSIPLSVASGSRGSLVTILIVLLAFVLSNIKLDYKGITISMLTVAFATTVYLTDIDIVLSYLNQSEFTGALRISGFLSNIANHDMSLVSEFQDARGNLNGAAFDYFYNNPSLFGIGYGQSLHYINADARPHNVIFSTLVEMGLFASIYFLVIISASGFFAFKFSQLKSSNVWLVLFFICFCSSAFRTPFYFLAAMPWFIIIMSIYFGINKSRDTV